MNLLFEFADAVVDLVEDVGDLGGGELLGPTALCECGQVACPLGKQSIVEGEFVFGVREDRAGADCVHLDEVLGDAGR